MVELWAEGVQLAGEGLHQVGGRGGVGAVRAVQHIEAGVAHLHPERRARRRAGGRLGRRVQQAEPSGAAARAALVIAAGEHPGRLVEQGFGRGEELRVPGAPVVAERAAGAAGVAGRAGGLAVPIVPHMDDQVGLARGRPGGDQGEGPLARVVAGLDGAALQPAAGVAEDQHPARLGLGQGRGPVADGGMANPMGDDQLTDRHREGVAGRRAAPHGHEVAVEIRLRAPAVGRGGAQLGSAVGQLGPVARRGSGARRCGQGEGQERQRQLPHDATSSEAWRRHCRRRPAARRRWSGASGRRRRRPGPRPRRGPRRPAGCRSYRPRA